MPPCGAGTRVGSRPGSRHTSLAARPRAHRAGLPGSGTARGGPLLPPPGTRTPCRYHRPVPSRPVPLRPHLPRRPNRHHPGASPPPPPPPAQAALQAGSRARPARGRSPCCQRSGGAVPSRGSLPPPRSVRVSSPRGEISRVLGRRSAPRSGSNCGPCVRQPSSRRVRGRRTGSSGDTRPDKPARSERRLTRGPL